MKLLMLSYIVMFYMNITILDNNKVKIKDSITNEELAGVKTIINDKDTLYSNFDGEVIFYGKIDKIKVSLVSYSDTIINYKTNNLVDK